MHSLLSTSRTLDRHKQRSNWHLITLISLGIITILTFLGYFLKTCQSKLSLYSLARKNTPKQDAIETSTAANVPDTATTVKEASYSAHILIRPLREIILAPVYKMNAANSAPDAWSAFVFHTSHNWHRCTVRSRNVHLHTVKTMYFHFTSVCKYTAQIVVILTFPSVLC
jgi:hypothetical protein